MAGGIERPQPRTSRRASSPVKRIPGLAMICPSCCYKNLPGDEVCRHCRQPLAPFDLPHPENHLERSVMYDQVKSLKQHQPVTIGESATIGEAMALMTSANVGALLVVNGAGQLTGIFSERD